MASAGNFRQATVHLLTSSISGRSRKLRVNPQSVEVDPLARKLCLPDTAIPPFISALILLLSALTNTLYRVPMRGKPGGTPTSRYASLRTSACPKPPRLASPHPALASQSLAVF